MKTFIVSYCHRNGSIVLNVVITATSYNTAIAEVKDGQEHDIVILSVVAVNNQL